MGNFFSDYEKNQGGKPSGKSTGNFFADYEIAKGLRKPGSFHPTPTSIEDAFTQVTGNTPMLGSPTSRPEANRIINTAKKLPKVQPSQVADDHAFRQKAINDPNANFLLKNWLRVIDPVVSNPTYDAFSQRSGAAASSAMGGRQIQAPSTGNVFADAGADALGMIGGMVAAPGAGMAMGAENVAGNLAGRYLPKLATNKVGNLLARGAGGGAAYEGTLGVVNDQSPAEIAKRAATGAATFGAMKGAGAFGRIPSALAGAGVFGGQSLASGASPEEALAQALFGGGMGALGGQSRKRANFTGQAPTFEGDVLPALGSGRRISGLLEAPKPTDWYMGDSGVSPDIVVAGRRGIPSGRQPISGLLGEPKPTDFYAGRNGTARSMGEYDNAPIDVPYYSEFDYPGLNPGPVKLGLPTGKIRPKELPAPVYQTDYYAGDAGVSKNIEQAGRKLLPGGGNPPLLPDRFVKGSPDYYGTETGTISPNRDMATLYEQTKPFVSQAVEKAYVPGIKPAPDFIGKVVDQAVKVTPEQKAELVRLLTQQERPKQPLPKLQPKNIGAVDYKGNLKGYGDLKATRDEMQAEINNATNGEAAYQYEMQKGLGANDLWQKIRDNGGIKPYKDGQLAEEYKGLKDYVKNKDGLTMDEMADTLGYSSEAEFIADLRKQESVQKQTMANLRENVDLYKDPRYRGMMDTIAEFDKQMKGMEKNINPADLSKLDQMEAAARERIARSKGQLNANPVQVWADYAIVGAAKIARGLKDFKTWSAEMVKDFGRAIESRLPDLWKKSNEVHRSATTTPPPAKKPGVVSPQQWKDKAKFLYKRETMRRNFEDTMGEDAPEMIKNYLDPIEKGEADRVRMLNKERQEIASFGIKGKSKQSELVQKYGEGQWTEKTSKDQYYTHKYTLEDLKKDAPKDWANIKKAAETMRQKYDYYLDRINESLTEVGYDPIPKRKDYFTHFEEVTDMFEKFGIPTKDNALPTDINGLTAGFKPGKNFFANALQRKGRLTTLDAIQGIDRYIEGATKLIFQTKNIKRLRSLDKRLREKFAGTDHLSNFVAELSEYTNILAGKKAMIDRAVEDVVGRKAYGIVDKVRKQVGANMIGANVGSAMTSFIPLTQSAATTSKPAFIKGMLQTIGSVFKDDGFVDKSDFLTRRMGSDRLVMSTWDKVADKGFWLFSVIDNFTSQTVVRSKYAEGLSKGMSEKAAMKQANDWAAKILADRSPGTMPTLFEAKTLKPFTQFQLEVNNQLSFLAKDIPRNFSTAGAASAIAQLLIFGYAFNAVYEKVVGRRPAFDPIWVLQKAYNDYTDPDKKTTDANLQTIRNIADQLPFAGMLTGGRIPLGSALPAPIDLATGKTTLSKELTKVGSGLLLPTGGMQIKKTIEGANALKKQGVYQNGDMLYPIKTDFPNNAKALIFGKNSLPEAKEYYDKNRRALGEKETKKMESLIGRGLDPKPMYERMQTNKRIDTVRTEMEGVAKNRSLSKEEKALQIAKLRARLAAVRASK